MIIHNECLSSLCAHVFPSDKRIAHCQLMEYARKKGKTQLQKLPTTIIIRFLKNGFVYFNRPE